MTVFTQEHFELMDGTMPCPNAAAHTHTPVAPGLEFREWSIRMAETHRQIRCWGCGLWKLWIPKLPGQS